MFEPGNDDCLNVPAPLGARFPFAAGD